MKSLALFLALTLTSIGVGCQSVQTSDPLATERTAVCDAVGLEVTSKIAQINQRNIATGEVSQGAVLYCGLSGTGSPNAVVEVATFDKAGELLGSVTFALLLQKTGATYAVVGGRPVAIFPAGAEGRFL